MSKRLNLTIPDNLHTDLEKWAKSQGRPTANLATFLLEESVALAKERDEFPIDAETKASDFLRDLVVGKPFTDGKLAALASELGIKAEDLAAIRDCYIALEAKRNARTSSSRSARS
jgi:CopG-like RHH_1 or ribbon-helix-helix domain, RHH_5